MQRIKTKTGWVFALFAVLLLGIQSFSNSKTNNDIDSIFQKLDRLSATIDRRSVQNSKIDDQITDLSQQLADLKTSLASSTLGVRSVEEPQEVNLQRDGLLQQNLNLQNELLRLRNRLDDVAWLEAQQLEQAQQSGSTELVREQIVELQGDLARIDELEKLVDLGDEALGIFLNELAIEIAIQQDNGIDVENRQYVLEALGSARDHIASQISADQLAIIDEYIVGERFRTFVLAP